MTNWNDWTLILCIGNKLFAKEIVIFWEQICSRLKFRRTSPKLMKFEDF